MELAAELCVRVEAMADRLCGSIPQEVGKDNGPTTGGGGILSQLEAAASELNGYTKRASVALSRIDARF